MNYKINKPTNPPVGYRMLIENQDLTAVRDLIWISENNGKTHRWAHAINQTKSGLKVASDTNKLYKEPKNIDDYFFFRCRKVGREKIT